MRTYVNTSIYFLPSGELDLQADVKWSVNRLIAVDEGFV